MPDDVLVRHPPERDRRSQQSVLFYVSCCSCCSCLHTLGGLAGALIGSLNTPQNNRQSLPEPRLPTVELSDRPPSGRWVFWTSLVMVLFVTGPLVGIWAMNGGLDDGTSSIRSEPQLSLGLLGSFAVHLYLGPALLVPVWLVSLVRLGFAKPRGTDEEIRGLHKILLYSLYGIAFGIALMLILLLVIRK